jgi:ATP-dependent exoDNAse (exonuclease V) beta subunit
MLEQAPQEEPTVWRTTTGSGTAAIELGNLTHAALATMDLAVASDLEMRVRRLADKLRVRSGATLAEATRLLTGFLTSPRYRELAGAREVFREVEFLLAWPPRDVRACVAAADPAQSAHRYLQGYLDCLYRDSTGRWQILDYKTNQISPETRAELVAKYELQMLVYGLAAEQSLGEPVAELTVHFLRTGDEHRYLWNDAARQRAVRLVDRAIAVMCRNPAENSSAIPPLL